MGNGWGGKAGWGVFTTAAVAFHGRMGDKTQIATAALAAQAESLIWIVAGTTLGMMIAMFRPSYWVIVLLKKCQQRWSIVLPGVFFLLLGLVCCLVTMALFGIFMFKIIIAIVIVAALFLAVRYLSDAGRSRLKTWKKVRRFWQKMPDRGV